ncbi:MAG: PHP domain-containing protein [Oscillospiraceae bacterium]|jgi:PHP family Zn ribbon phosphoesterase|nr:PHP domain-containing protein [Oscillospiraceae bacterium]
MLVPADLHIHSCLSPCADDDMTPFNLVNMAALAGIKILAVTDHNCAKNLPACKAAADAAGVALLPGIEATTREEAHILCYFPDVDAALAFGESLRGRLGSAPNVPRLFGNQIIMDENDGVIGHEDRLLIQATSLSVDAMAALCVDHGGMPVPAHINRGSSGLLNALGFLPGTRFAAVEVCRDLPITASLGGYNELHSSDAHRLEALAGPAQHLELDEVSAESAFNMLSRWYQERA